ncbi:MAG TPA: 3'-5' exonuclease, partial [Patescibacteria group bacterium]|nr:3'-5' exonuclease [Patescibacteria group bacterium]
IVGGFWGRLQIRDLLAYLRALANPLDEQALYETLASPLVGLSSDGLALLAHAARTAGRGAWETACALGEGVEPAEEGVLARLPARDREALMRFCAGLREERRAGAQRSISRLIERAIDAGGYREHVLGQDWGERRLANVHKLLRLARRFEASEGRDLRGFLDHVDRLVDAAGAAEPDAPVDSVEPDAIRLMTIHAAKGLEFPVVCVADLGRAPNTRMPRLLVEGGRIGLQLLGLDGERAAPALEYDELCEERRRAQAEEEDRILYVAMTRARERLLLSGSLDFERWPEPRDSGPPIAWLAPALAGGLPSPLNAVDPPVCDLALGDGEGTATVRCLLSSPASVGTILDLRPVGAAPAQLAFWPDPDVVPAGEGEPAGNGAADSRPRAQPARETDRITALSYTSLSELERCGYRYYLERALGLPEDRVAARAADGGGLEARVRGTLVHRLLESVDFVCPEAPSPADVGRLARELGVRVGAGEREEIAALIGAALASAPAARVAAAANVRREHPFAFALGPAEPLITGVIDLLAREANGGFLVLDYKSDRVGEEVDLAALVERDYGVQRLLYALAVLRDGGEEVEVVHWFLQRPHEPIGARFAAADRGMLEERLRRRVEGAHANGFGVSRRPHRGLCLTCPGRTGLCSWGEAETLREDPAT